MENAMADDNLTCTDSSLIQMSYNVPAISDLVALVDLALPSFDYTRSSADTAATTDSASAGLVKDASASDTVALTDGSTKESLYGRLPSDTVTITDAVFPWTDGILEVSLEGGSSLSAVLVKKTNAAITANVSPPRTVTLPRPPVEYRDSTVVDPNPPRRDR